MAFRRLLALGPWLAEAKYVWIALAVSLASMIVCLRPGTTEPVIRLTGLLLQLLGIATVVWGIAETRAFFGRPSLASKVLDWFKRCPIRGVTVSASVGTVVAHGLAGKLRGYASVSIDPAAPLDVRMTAVERNISLIHERITTVARSIDSDIGTLAERLAEEASNRERSSSELHGRLEGVATGGVHISAIGATWLFVGVILSTAAPEMAALLR